MGPEEKDYLGKFTLDSVEHLCIICAKSAGITYVRCRKELWEKLPEIRGLPPWADLRKMK